MGKGGRDVGKLGRPTPGGANAFFINALFKPFAFALPGFCYSTRKKGRGKPSFQGFFIKINYYLLVGNYYMGASLLQQI
jgi:hypothetical protein